MKRLALWGLVGGVFSLGVALPAQAQLADKISKAAGKLVDTVVGAEEAVSSTAPVAAASDKSARVTLLDKQTNRKQTLVLVSGMSQTVGNVDIVLKKCLPDYMGQLAQDVAWLDVTENAGGNGRTTPWFSGWMFNTYPEVSTLDHPRYDVMLQGCGTKARKAVAATGSAPVLDSSAPPEDTESAGGGDAFVVPGVKDDSKPAAPAAPVDAEAGDDAAPATAAPAAAVSAPVEAAPAAPAAEKPAGDQKDLHQLMDGVY